MFRRIFSFLQPTGEQRTEATASLQALECSNSGAIGPVAGAGPLAKADVSAFTLSLSELLSSLQPKLLPKEDSELNFLLSLNQVSAALQKTCPGKPKRKTKDPLAWFPKVFSMQEEYNRNSIKCLQMGLIEYECRGLPDLGEFVEDLKSEMQFAITFWAGNLNLVEAQPLVQGILSSEEVTEAMEEKKNTATLWVVFNTHDFECYPTVLLLQRDPSLLARCENYTPSFSSNRLRILDPSVSANTPLGKDLSAGKISLKDYCPQGRFLCVEITSHPLAKDKMLDISPKIKTPTKNQLQNLLHQACTRISSLNLSSEEICRLQKFGFYKEKLQAVNVTVALLHAYHGSDNSFLLSPKKRSSMQHLLADPRSSDFLLTAERLHQYKETKILSAVENKEKTLQQFVQKEGYTESVLSFDSERCFCLLRTKFLACTLPKILCSLFSYQGIQASVLKNATPLQNFPVQCFTAQQADQKIMCREDGQPVIFLCAIFRHYTSGISVDDTSLLHSPEGWCVALSDPGLAIRGVHTGPYIFDLKEDPSSKGATCLLDMWNQRTLQKSLQIRNPDALGDHVIVMMEISLAASNLPPTIKPT